MIRKIFKKKQRKDGKPSKIDAFLDKYNLPRDYFSVNRRSITRGIAVGTFWALIPMPMQMAGVMAVTPFLKFNVPLAIAIVWLSNPITYPPLFYLEYLTGNLLLGKEGLDGIELTMEWFKAHWDDIALSLYVGAFFYATVVNAVLYFVVNYLWIVSVKKERKEKQRKRNRQTQA
jgi:uncharacterized protein (DUF2062 family)